MDFQQTCHKCGEEWDYYASFELHETCPKCNWYDFQ